MNRFGLIAAVAAFAGCGAMASAATLDYQALADGTLYGESGYSTFIYGGLSVTATQGDDNTAAYVYLDRGNAGMGVCDYVASTGKKGNSGTNQCTRDSSDDSLNDGHNEILTFTAMFDMIIDYIVVNANHDGDGKVNETFDSYIINATEYVANATYPDDWKIDVGLTLLKDQSFTFKIGAGTSDSYISAIGISPVPVPAAGFLLLGGLGGLAALRRRKKA